MSARAFQYVTEHSPYRGAAFVIHLMIADRVNDTNGNLYWESAAKTARRARCDEKTVGRTLPVMVADGYLVVVDEQQHGGAERGRTYRFLYPTVDTMSRVTVGNGGHHVQGDEAPTVDISSPNGGHPVPDTILPTEGTKTSMRSQKNSDEWLAIRAKLISVCRINADSITQSERGKLHSATSELREVKATPAQIDMFVSWWQRTYPNAQITAKAISAHWSESEPEGGGMIFTAVEMGNMSTRTFFVGDRKYWYRETSKFGFKTNINYWKDTDEDWTTEDYERDGCSGRTNPYRLYEMMGGDEVDESVVVPIQNALGAFNRRRDSSEIVEEVAF